MSPTRGRLKDKVPDTVQALCVQDVARSLAAADPTARLLVRVVGKYVYLTAARRSPAKGVSVTPLEIVLEVTA